ncbi:MAG: hypothetical protein LUF81_04090 [Clostridiales bacterium]|nr:hypothetical protein [Clostridiales bacterium]
MGLFSWSKKQAQRDAVRQDSSWFRQHPRDAAYFSELFAQAAPDCHIASQVPAEALNPDADPDCAPVDFLFICQDCPVLAVSLLHQDTYRQRPFCATKTAVEQTGLPYLRFFADMANEPDYVLSRIREALASGQAAGKGQPPYIVPRLQETPGRSSARLCAPAPDSDTVSVVVQAENRWDLLSDLTVALTAEGVQAVSLTMEEAAGQSVLVHLRLSSDSLQQISDAIRRLSGIAGVWQVRQEA